MFLNPIPKKTKFLRFHKIALWDMICCCQRVGSRDEAIKDEKVNNISDLIINYPSIQAVFCNGKKSYHLFKKHFESLAVFGQDLPSTSPLNTQSFQSKREKWQVILDYL